MAKAPYWQELDSTQAVWSVIGPEGGVIQFFDRATQAPLAVFAVQSCPEFSGKFRGIAGKVPRTAKQLQAKLVAAPALCREMRTALSQLGIQVLKLVEREGRFEIRYGTRERKLFVGAYEEATPGPGPAPPVPAAASR
jgi:hypothetical protein